MALKLPCVCVCVCARIRGAIPSLDDRRDSLNLKFERTREMQDFFGEKRRKNGVRKTPCTYSVVVALFLVRSGKELLFHAVLVYYSDHTDMSPYKYRAVLRFRRFFMEILRLNLI